MYCVHINECGGCSLQQMEYPIQLQQKQRVVESIFAPFPVEPIIGSFHQWQYRNKMDFTFSQNKAGDRYLGLIKRKSRGKVFNLQECLISSPWFTHTLQSVKAWWDTTSLRAFHFHTGEGSLRTLTLRESIRTGERLIMLTVSSEPEFSLSQQQLKNLIELLKAPLTSIYLRLQQCKKGKPTQFYEMHLSGPEYMHENLNLYGKLLQFKISPSSFFQPHTAQAEILYTQAVDMLKLTKNSYVLDLYAGTATISIVIALKAKQVTAIELNPHAVFDGRENVKLNNLSNVEIICGDVGQVLSNIEISPDVVVVDPPRIGLNSEAINHLARLKPYQILYISCNPVTQAADIKKLTSYHLIKIQPVDQFPHTPHIENIALLERLQ